MGFPVGSDEAFRLYAPFIIVVIVIGYFLLMRQNAGAQNGSGMESVMFGGSDQPRDDEAAFPLVPAESFTLHRGVPSTPPIKSSHQYSR